MSPLDIAIETIASCGISASEAESICNKLSNFEISGLKQENLWHEIRNNILKPSHPIALHELLRDYSFQGWDDKVHGIKPIWKADEARLARTNIAQILKDKNFSTYDELYKWSIEHGRSFWCMMMERLDVRFEKGYRPTPENIVDTSNPKSPKWFPNAKFNIANSCFTAPHDAVALIYQKEGESELQRFTYGELDKESNKVANALVKHGFKPQDRIAIDMPFNVESVFIFLGILKMGGTLVSLADSFKAADLDIRFEASKPVKAIFTQDITGGLKSFPLYPTVIQSSLAPKAIVITTGGAGFIPLRDGDISFQEFIAGASDKFEAVEMDAEAYINVIFSSSTSSPKDSSNSLPKPPKAIPWKPTTALKSAIDAHLHHDMQTGKILCWPTNLGWMMGSFAIFAAMMNKATLAIFNGSATTPAFAKFIEQAKVNILGLVPSIAETWQRQNTLDGVDWSAIELFSSTGSPSNKTNYFWLMSRVQNYVPCFEYMGGTEIGGGYLICSYYQPASPSCFTTPNLGTDLYIWDKDGGGARRGEVFIVMRNGKDECPPMGLSTVLLNFDHDEKYFARDLPTINGALLREHGDVIIQHPNGFYSSNGRADDGININGIKTSSLDIENYIKDAKIEYLKEVAAVGVRPPEGGEDLLVIYALVDENSKIDIDRLKSAVREAIKLRNPQLARVHDVVVVPNFPYTATGKLMRRYLQDSYLENMKK